MGLSRLGLAMARLSQYKKARDQLAPRSHRWCRPDAHWLNPVSFSFVLAGVGQLLILPFKLLFFEGDRTDESGGPPLFEPSLKVEGDIGHIKSLTVY